jgi:probable addiction module antidote protein
MKKKIAKIKTRPWDAVEHLKSEADMAAYLEAALEDGDPALIAAALSDIARAKGMSQIARETGLGRESLYKRYHRKATRSSQRCSKSCALWAVVSTQRPMVNRELSSEGTITLPRARLARHPVPA